MNAVVTQKRPQNPGLLIPCQMCASPSIQTIRLDGAWWCECMGCGYRGPHGLTNHEAHQRWNAHQTPSGE
jgi:hypothetical protein